MTTYQTRAEQYVREQLPELEYCKSGCGCKPYESYHPGGGCVWVKEEIQLQHWLRMLGEYDSHKYALAVGGVLYRVNTEWELGTEVMRFNLTAGQPATEVDYQALCEILNIK